MQVVHISMGRAVFGPFEVDGVAVRIDGIRHQPHGIRGFAAGNDDLRPFLDILDLDRDVVRVGEFTIRDGNLEHVDGIQLVVERIDKLDGTIRQHLEPDGLGEQLERVTSELFCRIQVVGNDGADSCTNLFVFANSERLRRKLYRLVHVGNLHGNQRIARTAMFIEHGHHERERMRLFVVERRAILHLYHAILRNGNVLHVGLEFVGERRIVLVLILCRQLSDDITLLRVLWELVSVIRSEVGWTFARDPHWASR